MERYDFSNMEEHLNEDGDFVLFSQHEQIIKRFIDRAVDEMDKKDKAFVDLWESKEDVIKECFNRGNKLMLAELLIKTQRAKIEQLKKLCAELVGPGLRKENE